jgi:hypothetical protein
MILFFSFIDFILTYLRYRDMDLGRIDWHPSGKYLAAPGRERGMIYNMIRL